MNPVTMNQLGLSPDRPFAVGHFNVHNHEFIRGVVEAAKAERSPAVIAIGMQSIKYMGLAPLFAAAKAMCAETGVPLAIHLDHARDEEIVRQALALGFTSVMFDGSALAFEENVRRTREVVRLAHDFGATAEGEVGIVPQNGTAVGQGDLTDPDLAAVFAGRTGVDFLAVSLGSVHGMTAPGASLNQPLLARLKGVLPCPMVLHGASGVLDSEIRQAIENGIRKVNVNTGLKVACKKALGGSIARDPEADFLADLRCGVEMVTAAVAGKMRLFGSSGKA
jgi:ketose-bisphosphate aldolase